MTELTPDIIRARLPVLAKKLLQETSVARQKPVIGVQLNDTPMPFRYSQLVADLNDSPPNMAPRIIANYRDRGAILPKREENIIIYIRNE